MIDAQKESSASKSHLVVQSNTLVREFFNGMTFQQLKLFYYLIGSISKDDDDFYPTDVDYAVLHDITCGHQGSKGGVRYISNLLHEFCETRTANFKSHKAKPDENKPEMRSWLRLIRITRHCGWYSACVQFEDWLFPHLIHQSRFFTAFQYADVAELSSLNALKLYPLLCSYKSQGSKEFKFPELKALLGVTESFPTYRRFSEKVLKPILEDINANTSLTVTTELMRDEHDKRKTTGVRFIMATSDKTVPGTAPKVKISLERNSDTIVRVIRAA